MASTTNKEAARPGGRSARVQQAVHQAVRTLQQEGRRDALSVPQIAELAGVTPSTIYRRWGNLAELLADVSLERLHLDTAPVDTGSLAGDLQAWCEQYLEEMTSVPGRRGLDDIMASADDERRQRCRECSEAIMQTLRERALARGEVAPPVAVLMDTLIAPLTYHLLYARGEIPPNRLRGWITTALTAGHEAHSPTPRSKFNPGELD